MQLISYLSATALMAYFCAQTTQPKPANTWKSVATKGGFTISTPVDLGSPTMEPIDGQKSPAETYSPKGWSDCEIAFSKRTFAKDEDAKDSDVVKLENVVFEDIELDDDRVSSISYPLQQGWPAVDVEGKQKDGTLFHYHVCRAKTFNFVVTFTGKTLPSSDVRKRMLDSLKLPKDVLAGKLTKWGPSSKKQTLGDTHIEIWSPIELKSSEDFPDFGTAEAKGVGFSGEFGYCSYTVSYVDLPTASTDLLDDDTIDALMKSQTQDDDDPAATKYSEFKSFTVNDVKFRTVTYVDDTLDGRIDIAVKDGKFYQFSVTVPRGMLDSEDVKKFFGSIVLHA